MKNNMQMNKCWEQWFPIATILIALWSGCADPTFIGADILEEDQVNAAFTDTVTIRSRTISGDSVLTYSPSPNWLTSYLLGDFKDPIFGRTFAEIYAQPTLELSSVSYLRPNFKDAIVDSIILVLPYSAAGFYGNTEQEFAVEVYELTDSLSRDSVYYSSQVFNYSNQIGDKTFIPGLDSVTYIDYRNTLPDTVSLAQLRIPLNDNFTRRLLLADTSTYLTNGAFQSFFKGFVVRPATQTSGMISFNLVPSGGSFDAGIYVYFRRDSIPTQYRFPVSFNSPVTAHYENDYDGVAVAPLINSSAFSDSLAVVQGAGALLMELEFPNLEALENAIVNKAELIIPVAALDNDDPDLFPPAVQLYAFFYNVEADNYFPIDDVVLPAGNVINIVFGGLLQRGSNGEPDFYRMNISAFFQEMLKDDGVSDIPDVIYLGVAPRAERISRSILYGASHPQYPVKLNLTYTTQ